MAELNNFLTSIADAIRNKKGTTEKINASNFANEIESIESGSGGVVVVDELPTENIQEGVIYQVNEVSDIVVYAFTENIGLLILDNAIAALIGASPNLHYYVVDELPSTPNISDLQTFSALFVYIYKDIPYMYVDMGSGEMWLELSILFADFLGGVLENKGYVVNENNIFEEGIYVTYKKGKQGILYTGYDVLLNDSGWNDYKGIFEKTVVEYKSDKIKKIREYAFYRCSVLKKVELLNAQIINDYAFSGCSSLTSINIPNVMHIYQYAFQRCVNLTSITLPSVRIIQNYAFSGCQELKEVFLYDNADGMPVTCGNLIFQICHDDLKIYVPANLVDAYKSATNWSDYADKIVGY